MGKGIFGLCSIFLVGYLARKLGPVGFGRCSALFAWISTLIVIADMGLYMTGIRRMSVSSKNQTVILGNLLSARFLISLAIVLFSLVIINNIPYESELKKLIILTLPVVVLVSCARAFKSLFQARLIMQYVVVGEVIGCIVMAALTYTIIEACQEYLEPVRGVILAVFTGILIYCGMAFYFSMSLKVFKPAFDINYIKNLIQEAWPLGLSAIMAILYFRFDMLMLSWMKPADHVGIYGAAYTIVEISAVLPALFLGSMLPFFSRSILSRKDDLQEYYQKSFNFLAIVIIPVFAGGILLADPIMNLMTGVEFNQIGWDKRNFHASAIVFRLLVSVTMLIFWGQLNGHLLVAAKKQKTILRIYYFLLPLNIGLNYLLIPKYSYNGAAIATLISEISAIIVSTVIVKKQLDLFPEMGIVWRSVVCALIMIFVIFFVDFHVVFKILIGVVVYFFIYLLLFKSYLRKCL